MSEKNSGKTFGHIIYFILPDIISYEEIYKMIEVAYEGIRKIVK